MKANPLDEAIAEMADDMRSVGVLNETTHAKITLRTRGAKPPAVVDAMTAEAIRAMREKANLSQAVFARRLNLTVGYVSQLERGVKRPSGPALVLLDLIRRKGLDAIM